MKLQSLRDIIIMICAIVFVLVYTITSLFPFAFLAGSFGESMISPSSTSFFSYSSCTAYNRTNTITTSISNYGSEIVSNITCRIVDAGELRAEVQEQTIASLPVQSTDVCIFTLSGVSQKPIRIEVEYDGKFTREGVLCNSW